MNFFLQNQNANKAPMLSAAQSSRSKLRPGIKNRWMNSVVKPQMLVAIAILIKYRKRSLLVKDELLNGQQNKMASSPNTPTCTNLSKFIPVSQSIFGISFPGRHTSTSTTKNQAMPGINFLKDSFILLYIFSRKTKNHKLKTKLTHQFFISSRIH